jgi:hypothetical protein
LSIETKRLNGVFPVLMTYTTITGKEINKLRAVPQVLTSSFLLLLTFGLGPLGLCLYLLIRWGLKREFSLREA